MTALDQALNDLVRARLALFNADLAIADGDFKQAGIELAVAVEFAGRCRRQIEQSLPPEPSTKEAL